MAILAIFADFKVDNTILSQIPVLKRPSNYPIWSACIQSTLQSLSIWKFIDGSIIHDTMAIGDQIKWITINKLGKRCHECRIQVWRLLILILLFDSAPSDVSKEEAGPSMRQDMLLWIDFPLKQDLKGKKKIVFSVGGLLLDKDHFNVLDHYFLDPSIPYTSTLEFLASAPLSIFDETYIPIEHGTHEGNLPPDCQDIYRRQEV